MAMMIYTDHRHHQTSPTDYDAFNNTANCEIETGKHCQFDDRIVQLSSNILDTTLYILFHITVFEDRRFLVGLKPSQTVK